MAKQNLYEASRQWASRPNDERFISLMALRDSVAQRTANSFEVNTQLAEIEPLVVGDDIILTHEGSTLHLNNWTSQQLGARAGIPMEYIKSLPPRLAAVNMSYGLRSAENQDVQLLVNGQTKGLRAITSQKYGRIQDLDIVDRISDMVDVSGGIWQIPAASYQVEDPLRATTLYASDRDIFIFLVDPTHPIEIPGQNKPSYRGFFAWNSEVGNSVFGLTTFLYEYVCDNRIIWGSSNVQTVRIVHNQVGPDKYLDDVVPQLIEYAGRSSSIDLNPITNAMNRQLIALASGDDPEDVYQWVGGRTKIPVGTVRSAFQLTEQEEAPVETVWDAVQSLTAYARTNPHTDARTKMEARASSLLQ